MIASVIRIRKPILTILKNTNRVSLSAIRYNSFGKTENDVPMDVPAKENTRSEKEKLQFNIQWRDLQIKRLQKSKEEATRELEEMNAKLSTMENGDAPTEVQVKLPDGTRDFSGEECAIQNYILKTVVSVFGDHGFRGMETSILEMKDILTTVYGKENASKMLFDLPEEDGEIVSLRYDLTVPFAQYFATNKIEDAKLYQIGQVFKRDAVIKETIKADVIIAGDCDTMLAEVDCVRIAYDVLNALDLRSFRVKINHRLLLDGLFEACNIDNSKFRPICSAIDKMDKEKWEVVREEMLEKGLSDEDADKIGKYVELAGGPELAEDLLKDELLLSAKSSRRGLEEIKLFLHYCSIYELSDKITFDMRLTPEFDYYTGLFYEVVLDETSKNNKSVGSLAAGGRYDNLVAVLDSQNKGQPCVGISIDIGRLFSVIEAKMAKEKTNIRAVETQVFVVSAQKNLMEERMKIICDLWGNDISAEHSYMKDPELLQQLQYCEEQQIPYAIIIGESELQQGIVKIRNVQTREEVYIPRENLISELIRRLS